tara:strand:+ start:212 stop:4015 length:3804 start_codon:yes stop_codon:yes gene_type:complete
MAEPLENIYTPQDIDLTIGRDVQSVTSRLPLNKTANISTPQGFMDDVFDEFMLNWVGQTFQRNNLRDDFNFSLDIDPLYDPFEKDNIAGYEEYISEFKEVRNKEHHDFLKAIIDTNLARRTRLETSDGFLRNIGAGLLGNFPDPINFVPIPLVRGLSFAQKATRGALISMGLVGATEPIRRKLDPTATNQETIGYIASAGLFGGALTGLLGRAGRERSTLGKAINKTLKDKGGINKVTSKYFEAHHKTEGRKDFEADGFNYRVGDDAAEAKVVNVKTNKGEGGFERLASYDSQTNTIKINETLVRTKYQRNEHMYSNQKGITPIAKSEFKTVDDYISFLMKKEINRVLYFRKGQKENPIDYENRLNAMTLAELKDAVSVNRQTDLSGPKAIFKILENFTNFGKIVNKQSDPSIAIDAQRLTGDFATSQRAERLGLAPNKSALVEAETKWNAEFIMAKDELDKAFEFYRTDKANGKQILGLNMQVGRIKAVDAYENVMRRINRRQKKDGDKWTETEFRREVHDAVVDNDIFNAPDLHPAVKQAAVAVRKFYERFRKDAEELGMFASQGSYNRLVEKIDGVIEDLKSDLKTKPLNKFQEARTNKLLSYLNKRRKTIKQIQKELEDGTISPPFTKPEEYVNRLFSRDKILANPELFKSKLRDHYTRNPFKKVIDGKTITAATDPASIERRVQQTYDRIVGIEANTGDGDGILGYDFDNGGVFKMGVRPLMSRVLDIPTKDVKEFVETDIAVLMNNYTQRMGKAVEIARTFGDKHMEIHLYQMERKLISKQLKSEKDNTKINEVLNAFEDQKDNMYGALSSQDPASFGARNAQLLRDWASLAYMGKVIFSAFPDIARPFMTAGFGKTFNVAFKSHAANTSLYGEALQQVRWMTPIIESQTGSARQKFQEAGGQIQSFGKSNMLNNVHDKIATGLNKAQGPFYFLNLLTFHTQMWKQVHSMVAAHRFIEDSIKWSKGTASEFDKKRLLSYGIDEKTAKLISEMPYETDLKYGTLYANYNQWGTKAGGKQARNKIQQAIWGDVQRTIITPTATDKFNMMQGVIRLNSKTANAVMKSLGPFGRMLGYTETRLGGKLSNAYMGLPFQFFSWGIAANRKLLISGLQGRDAAPVMGMVTMVGLAMLGDYMKNPRYWIQKSTEEKLIRALELSGVFGIFSDANFMLETITRGGAGLRPALGQELRFGDPDTADVIGEFTGAGPSIIADFLYAFGTDSGWDERSATLRRMIPLQNLLYWDRKFKNIWNAGSNALYDVVN